ncbi:MAG TPA: carboxypeptidase-like regulatory domain-containing protein [Longimicrobium sp.]|nr:carboxypeptidase-like regulatory domain-containing protein [Longimicrobium sp.]
MPASRMRPARSSILRLPFITITAGALICAALLGARPVHAQTVRGTVVDAESGHPVAGAVVVLLDQDGRRHGAVLSGPAGEYRLDAPRAGAYVLRAERVGYQSITSLLLRLAEGETVVHRLEAGAAGIVLEPVQARGRARDCTLRPDGSDQTAVAWAEARKALTATALAADAPVRGYETRLYRLRLRLDDLAVEREERWTLPGRGRTPFVTTPLRRLASTGWVHPDGDSIAFHAPDARTLLSDEFLDHHCFRLRPGEGDRDGMVGLEFAPVRGRRVPDVHGILWMDRQGARLRYLEYTYTELEWVGTVQEIGGRVEFAQAPDGTWIVSRWYIRMPMYFAAQNGNEPPRMTGVVEQGGDVVGIGGGAPAVVAGTVIDTVTRLPVAGVQLSLEGFAAAALTDSTGAYRLEGVPAGPGWLRVRSPALDEMGLEPLRIPIAPAAGEGETRTVVLPRPVDVLGRACAGFAGAHLVGWVHSGERRVRLADAMVQARWDGPPGSGVTYSATVPADGRGVYALCGATPGARVGLTATTGGRRGSATVQLPQTGAVLQAIRIMIRRGTALSRPRTYPFGPPPDVARLSGRVLDARGRPVRGAAVRIGPEQPPLATGRRGAFTWSELPPGRYTLLVSRPGLADQAVPVVLGSGMLMEVTVRPEAPPPRGH